MEENFKVGDCVLLKSDNTRRMTIAEIFEELQEATCIWIADDIIEPQKQDFPLSVLKHCPRELSEEEILRRTHEIIPPRKHL